MSGDEAKDLLLIIVGSLILTAIVYAFSGPGPCAELSPHEAQECVEYYDSR